MKLVSTLNSPEKYFPSRTSSWLRGLDSIHVKSPYANGVCRSTGGGAGAGGVVPGAAAGAAASCALAGNGKSESSASLALMSKAEAGGVDNEAVFTGATGD